MSAFGFEIPQGDPAALTAASTSWRRLGLALINEGDAVAGGARMTLGSAGWQGPASQAFADNSERLIKAFTADADACGRAATALSKLSDALAHAQQVARQALADCGRAQGAVNTHQQAATDAGNAAQAADEQAASARSIRPRAPRSSSRPTRHASNRPLPTTRQRRPPIS